MQKLLQRAWRGKAEDVAVADGEARLLQFLHQEQGVKRSAAEVEKVIVVLYFLGLEDAGEEGG
jgi:hypothetical protein